MSRDKRLNRTQEVVGSSPISSTIKIKNLEPLSAGSSCLEICYIVTTVRTVGAASR